MSIPNNPAEEAFNEYDKWLTIFKTTHLQSDEQFRNIANKVKHFYRLHPKFIEAATSKFDLPSSFLYCSMLEIQEACAKTTEKNVRAYAWLRMKNGALKKRVGHDGVEQSLAELFVDEFFSVFGFEWHREDPVVLNTVKKMFMAVLANHVNCAVWTRRAFRQLKKGFGPNVEWASAEDEKHDVLFRVFGLPLSAKTGTEGADVVLDRYRSVDAFCEPLFYVGMRFDEDSFKGVLTVARRGSGGWQWGELPELKHWLDVELFKHLM